MEKKLVTIAELAPMLRLPKSTIYKYTQTKMIPHYKIGKRLCFDSGEIEKWIRSKRVEVLEIVPKGALKGRRYEQRAI
jgi:excisionase family DNA binding protein